MVPCRKEEAMPGKKLAVTTKSSEPDFLGIARRFLEGPGHDDPEVLAFLLRRAWREGRGTTIKLGSAEDEAAGWVATQHKRSTTEGGTE